MKEAREELFPVQRVLLDAPALSSEVRKLVPLATVPPGTRAAFYSSALQHCPVRTLSVHHGFFKHTVFAQIPRRTY